MKVLVCLLLIVPINL